VGFTAQSRALGVENAIGMATVDALGSAAGAIVIYFVSLKVGRAAIARFGKRVRVS
jgi:membrane protein YqaA with SNARE-associated domain